MEKERKKGDEIIFVKTPVHEREQERENKLEERGECGTTVVCQGLKNKKKK